MNSDSESENDHQYEEEGQQLDFCSNEDLINRRQNIRDKSKESSFESVKTINEPRVQDRKNFERQNCPKDLSDLLQELILDGKKIPSNISPIINQIIRTVQLITPIYESVSYQKEFNSSQEIQCVIEGKLDYDEQKEQLENYKNSEEGTSHSTEDIQESINSNKIVEQVNSPNTNTKIQLKGASKQIYQSDCGGDTKYMEENLATVSGTAHSVNGTNNLDLNYKGDPLATSLSPAIIYKKKDYPNQTAKKNDSSDQKQSIEEEQSKFVIIRSSKSFIPEQAHTHGNQQNKKKKKKRSKAVGPQQTSVVKDEQSSKLNAFMRSIVSTVPEEQIAQVQIPEIQSIEPPSQIVQSVPIKKQENKKPTKASQQPVYVKKSVNEPLNALTLPIDKTNDKSSNTDFIQNSSAKFSNFLKNDEQPKQQSSFSKNQFQSQSNYTPQHRSSLNSEYDDKPINNHTKRFDNFINEKESTQYSSQRNIDHTGTSERPKKKENNKHQHQQHKKSANWGNSNNRNGKKNAQSPQDSLMKRNSYHSGISHVAKKDQSQTSQNDSYISNPVSRHKSLNESQYEHSNGMLNDYNQYDNYQQMDQSQIPFMSLEQIQSLLTNAAAMMHSQQQYIKQHAQAQLAFEAADNSAKSFDCQNQAEVAELTDQFFERLEKYMKALEKEIEKKLDSVRKERQLAITTLEEIIKKTYNENSHYNSSNHKNFVGIRMYGSMASGLAIDSSDVDLAVTGLDFHGNRDSHLKEMRELYLQLSYIKSKSSIKFIETATVPVIKLIIDLQKIHEQTSKTGKKSINTSIKANNDFNALTTHEIDPSMRFLGIDITFEDSQGCINEQFGNFSWNQNVNNGQPSKINLGIQCISHIQSLRMKFPDLKPIVMVLKRLLQLKDLNQPYHGGISSYSLVLMTSTFLHRCDSESMGINLTEFLNYYGNFFDPQTTQLDGKDFTTRFSENTLDPMVVIDPLNPSNNTTRSSFRISEIQYVFKRAHNVIIEKLEEFKKSADKSQEFDVIKYIVDNQDNILM